MQACSRKKTAKGFLFTVGLRLALLTSVSRVARAEACRVVARSTSRAVASFGRAVSAKRIHSGGALNKAAVGAAETVVAFASVVVLGVPGIVVLGCDVLSSIVWDVVAGKLLKTLAGAMPRAAVRAC